MVATKGASDNLDKVPKEPSLIEIVKEDILRILCERSKKTSLEVIKDESRLLISFCLKLSKNFKVIARMRVTKFVCEIAYCFEFVSSMGGNVSQIR